MESRSESAPGTELPESKNFFSRLAGVYFSPRETFREIGLSPKVLVPIIAMIVIGALAGIYLSRNLDVESMMAGRMEEAVAAGRMTQEQMEQQLALVSKFASTQMVVFAAFGSLAVTLLVAAGFKLISSLIGAENRFKSVFAVTIYAMIAVSIIQYALIVLILSLKGSGGVDISNINSLVASNLGAVFAGILGEDALPKFLMRLAGYVDIFAIWIIALLAIGYSAVSRKSEDVDRRYLDCGRLRRYCSDRRCSQQHVWVKGRQSRVSPIQTQEKGERIGDIRDCPPYF